MQYYGQNQEDKYILEYFKGQTGLFLEVGAFNPITFSNTRALVELQWKGIYIEPSPTCFEAFVKEYNDNKNISLIKAALGNKDGLVKFYDSIGDALSSTSVQHKEKWEAGYDVKFNEIEVLMVSVTSFTEKLLIQGNEIDFLNLDVESTNIELFNLFPDWFWEQLKMICIEHDSQQDYIISKLQPFGFKELHRNGENLIMAK